MSARQRRSNVLTGLAVGVAREMDLLIGPRVREGDSPRAGARVRKAIEDICD